MTKKELNQACGSIYDLVLQMKQWPLHYQQTCSGQLCTSLITFTKYQHRQPKLYSIMCALRECTRTKFIGQLLVGTLISISHLAVGLSFVGQFLVLPPTDGCLFSGCLSFGWLASGDGPWGILCWSAVHWSLIYWTLYFIFIDITSGPSCNLQIQVLKVFGSCSARP